MQLPPTKQDLIAFIKSESSTFMTIHILHWLNENPDHKSHYKALVETVINKSY